MIKVSQEQQRVLDHLVATGLPLRPWRGGWWTTEEEPARTDNRVPRWTTPPKWSTGTITVRSMSKRGLLRRLRVHEEHWRDHVAITDAGRDAQALALPAAPAAAVQ